MQNVIAARRDPHAALKRNLDVLVFGLPQPQVRLHIGFLVRNAYPRRLAAPLAETFAFEVKCFGEAGMKTSTPRLTSPTVASEVGKESVPVPPSRFSSRNTRRPWRAL